MVFVFMEGSVCKSSAHCFLGSSSPPLYKLKNPHFCNLSYPLNRNVPRSLWSSKVGGQEPPLLRPLGSCSVADLEKELEEEGKEEWMEIEMEMGKCKEGKNLVEVLECLEREAIMGDDKGREPNDYYRRAHIFDKSSRVFQALKERTGTDSNHQS